MTTDTTIPETPALPETEPTSAQQNVAASTSSSVGLGVTDEEAPKKAGWLGHIKEEFHDWMCDGEREADDIMAWFEKKL